MRRNLTVFGLILTFLFSISCSQQKILIEAPDVGKTINAISFALTLLSPELPVTIDYSFEKNEYILHVFLKNENQRRLAESLQGVLCGLFPGLKFQIIIEVKNNVSSSKTE